MPCSEGAKEQRSWQQVGDTSDALSLAVNWQPVTDRAQSVVSVVIVVVVTVVRCCSCCCGYATCAAAAAAENKKQTIRFYCFLVCEELREVDAAGCCGLLLHMLAAAATTATASGRKQQAVVWQNPKRSYNLQRHIPASLKCNCKQGRCTSCQNEQLLCKNVAQLTCSMCCSSVQILLLLSCPTHSRCRCTALVVCLVGESSRCATPQKLAYGIWKLIV